MSCILHTWVTWVLNIFVSWSQTQRTQRSKSRNPIDGPVYVFDKKQCHDMSEYLHDDPKHPKKHPWPGTIPVGYLLYLHLFTSKESTWINYQFGFTQHLWMIFPHFPAMGCSSHGSSYLCRLPIACSHIKAILRRRRRSWHWSAGEPYAQGVFWKICVYLYGSFH